MIYNIYVRKRGKEITTMELIYRTIDGKEFTDMHEAQHYELHLLHEKVQMFDPHGNSTIDPDYAMAIFLSGEHAADAFIKIAEKDGTNANGISSGDEGVYVWDSLDEAYKYIEIESLRAAHSALGAAIKARWDN
jgi:hypothetical protein